MRQHKSQIFVMNADGTGLVQLSNGVASDLKPNWSPNGAKLVFSSNASGSSEIWTLNGADGSGRTQITNDAHSNIEPAWSPDGSQIVYTSHLNATTVVTMAVTPTGGAPTAVTPSSSSNEQPDWGPVPAPPPDVPEVPFAVALPGVMVLGIGAWGWRRRKATPSIA